MDRIEKEKMGKRAVIDAAILILFCLLMYITVKGYNTINPKSMMTFSTVLGQVMLYSGLALTLFAFFKKRGNILRYSVFTALLGFFYLLLYYCYYLQNINQSLGRIYYYGFLAFAGLYIVGSLIYTVLKVRK